MPTSVKSMRGKFFFVKRSEEWDFEAAWNLPMNEAHNSPPGMKTVDLQTNDFLGEASSASIKFLLCEDTLIATGLSPARLEGRASSAFNRSNFVLVLSDPFSFLHT